MESSSKTKLLEFNAKTNVFPVFLAITSRELHLGLGNEVLWGDLQK